MIKISRLLFFFCAVGLSIVSCNGQQAQPTFGVTETIQASQTPEPINTIQPPWTPTATATPIPVYNVIDEKNVNELETLYQWGVENIIYGSTSSWLSDSKQFIIPISKVSGSGAGIQSFDVDNFSLSWFTPIADPWGVTTDKQNQVIIYFHGLHIIDAQGKEVRTITTRDNCGESLTEYIVAIPGTDLIITGHQDAEDEGGLNNPGVNIASLIIWDINKNSCSALLKRFNGRLFSLSVSPDGHYISYSFGVRKPSYDWLLTTRIYDLKLQKETCHANGFIAQFNRQNELAVYNPDDDTIKLIMPSDCKQRIKFNVNIKLLAFAFSPNGDLLAGASESVVNIWSVKSGEKLKKIDLQTSLDNLPLISFSPDGRFFVITTSRESPQQEDKVMLWGILEK